MGYIDPTPIQLRSFPVILSGRDLIASAQTGTGKTAAFALPILTKLASHGAMRCLVLEPTRELAAQVETAFRDYTRFNNIKVAVLYGGVGYGRQREQVAQGMDIIVATPGRLLDFLQEGALKLKDLDFLVLDEVDRMLDMGFLPDVKKIIGHCPTKRQTLVYSATMPPAIEALCNAVVKDPEKIEIGAQRTPAETVTHAFYPVATAQKNDLLMALLQRIDFNSVMIFNRTKVGADRLAGLLKEAKHSVAILHANRSQTERFDALEGFKSGKYEIMVATDIAARGIDVAGVSHVINYDVPQHPEDYVHRIGRTGRAQNVGDAYTIITAEELDHVEAIERFIGQKVPRLKLENFDYIYTTLLDEERTRSARSVRGGRTAKGYRFGRR